jgi:5-methylcytosine-specific restriction endonuclease McrA
MDNATCPICGSPVIQPSGRGRRRIYCGDACNRKASHQRESAAKQEARRRAAEPCAVCGAEVSVGPRGPVPRWCSATCRSVAAGNSPALSAVWRECALPECDTLFRSGYEQQRCCSPQHNRRLYRLENPPVREPWGDARRDRCHRRRARLLGASTGRPVQPSRIAERDGFTCGICSNAVDMGTSWPDPMSPSLDHIVPLSKGGAHDPDNVQLAHLTCNVAKGSRSSDGRQLLPVG